MVRDLGAMRSLSPGLEDCIGDAATLIVSLSRALPRPRLAEPFGWLGRGLSRGQIAFPGSSSYLFDLLSILLPQVWNVRNALMMPEVVPQVTLTKPLPANLNNSSIVAPPTKAVSPTTLIADSNGDDFNNNGSCYLYLRTYLICDARSSSPTQLGHMSWQS